MLKKIAVTAALLAGFSWCAPASATAKPITDAQAGADARADVHVRTYDLNNQADVAALLTLIFGLDVDVSADVAAKVDADVKADVSSKVGVKAN